MRLKPGDARVLASLGQFYVSQKRWPEAFQSLNAAIAAAPKEIFYKHELAVAKTASGDVDAGLALFTQLVGPEKAHYNVAYLLRQEGKTEAAVQQCRVALQINPNFEPAKAMLAQIHDRQMAGDPRGPARRNSSGHNDGLADPDLARAPANRKPDLPPAERSARRTSRLRSKPGFVAASRATCVRRAACDQRRRDV